MSKKKKSDVVDNLISHFRLTMIEALTKSDCGIDSIKKIVKEFDKINVDEYRYIRRIVEGK
jgi:hypothetical protein